MDPTCPSSPNDGLLGLNVKAFRSDARRSLTMGVAWGWVPGGPLTDIPHPENLDNNGKKQPRWWFQPTHLKNMRMSNWIISIISPYFPNFRDEQKKNLLKPPPRPISRCISYERVMIFHCQPCFVFGGVSSRVFMILILHSLLFQMSRSTMKSLKKTNSLYQVIQRDLFIPDRWRSPNH